MGKYDQTSEQTKAHFFKHLMYVCETSKLFPFIILSCFYLIFTNIFIHLSKMEQLLCYYLFLIKYNILIFVKWYMHDNTLWYKLYILLMCA